MKHELLWMPLALMITSAHAEVVPTRADLAGTKWCQPASEPDRFWSEKRMLSLKADGKFEMQFQIERTEGSLHCAPQTVKYLGTWKLQDGALSLSFSAFPGRVISCPGSRGPETYPYQAIPASTVNYPVKLSDDRHQLTYEVDEDFTEDFARCAQ